MDCMAGCRERVGNRIVNLEYESTDAPAHKVRYYLERRDAEFGYKMAEVLCVFSGVQVLKRRSSINRMIEVGM